MDEGGIGKAGVGKRGRYAEGEGRQTWWKRIRGRKGTRCRPREERERCNENQRGKGRAKRRPYVEGKGDCGK